MFRKYVGFRFLFLGTVGLDGHFSATRHPVTHDTTYNEYSPASAQSVYLKIQIPKMIAFKPENDGSYYRCWGVLGKEMYNIWGRHVSGK